MRKTKEIIDLLLSAKEIILIVCLIVVAAINFTFFYKFVPLIETDREADFRISANEKNIRSIEKNVEDITKTLSDVKDDTSFMRGVLSNQ